MAIFSKNKNKVKDGVQEALELVQKNKFDEAIDIVKLLYDKDQLNPLVAVTFWQILGKSCSWINEYDKVLDTATVLILKGAVINKPLTISVWESLNMPFTSTQLKILAVNYINHLHPGYECNTSSLTLSKRKTDSCPAIIVGFLTSDARDHAVGQLIQGWVQHHDVTRMKLIILSLKNDYMEHHAMDKRIKAGLVQHADEFIDLTMIQDQSAEGLAEFIRGFHLDILIDANGHTDGERMDIIRLRPAKVVSSWIGFAGTTGSQFHDYVLVDNVVAPFPSSVVSFTEKLAYLDPCYIPSSHLQLYPHLNHTVTVFTSQGKRIVVSSSFPIMKDGLLTAECIERLWTMYKEDEMSYEMDGRRFHNGRLLHFTSVLNDSDLVFTTREEFDLSDSAIVFYSNAQLSKITPDSFANWAEILKAVPDSILWINTLSPTILDNLKKYVEPEIGDRIVPGSWTDWNEKNIRKCTLADLELDCLPYGGHSMTLEALSVNLPVLTLKGHTWAGSVSASILTSLGLSQLVTFDRKSFIETGTRLGNNPEELDQLSLTIQKNKWTCPIWNGKHFAMQMERVCHQMMQRYEKGLLPIHLPPSNQSSEHRNRFSLQDFNFGTVIVKGQQTTILNGQFKGEKVVIKIVNTNAPQWTRILSELEVYKILNPHPSVVQLLLAFGNVHGFLVFEPSQSNLEAILSQEKKLSRKEASRFILQLLTGLNYIHHEKNILHRNLKPSNCILDTRGNLKISGFQHAVICMQKGKFMSLNNSPPSMSNAAFEVLKDKLYSFQSDVYAVGLIMYWIFNGQHLYLPDYGTQSITTAKNVMNIIKFGVPFLDEDGNHVYVKKNNTLNSIQRTPITERLQMGPPFRQMITQMIHFDPKHRPTCSTLLSDFPELYSLSDVTFQTLHSRNPSRHIKIKEGDKLNSALTSIASIESEYLNPSHTYGSNESSESNYSGQSEADMDSECRNLILQYLYYEGESSQQSQAESSSLQTNIPVKASSSTALQLKWTRKRGPPPPYDPSPPSPPSPPEHVEGMADQPQINVIEKPRGFQFGNRNQLKAKKYQKPNPNIPPKRCGIPMKGHSGLLTIEKVRKMKEKEARKNRLCTDENEDDDQSPPTVPEECKTRPNDGKQLHKSEDGHVTWDTEDDNIVQEIQLNLPSETDSKLEAICSHITCMIDLESSKNQSSHESEFLNCLYQRFEAVKTLLREGPHQLQMPSSFPVEDQVWSKVSDIEITRSEVNTLVQNLNLDPKILDLALVKLSKEAKSDIGNLNMFSVPTFLTQMLYLQEPEFVNNFRDFVEIKYEQTQSVDVILFPLCYNNEYYIVSANCQTMIISIYNPNYTGCKITEIQNDQFQDEMEKSGVQLDKSDDTLQEYRRRGGISQSEYVQNSLDDICQELRLITNRKEWTFCDQNGVCFVKSVRTDVPTEIQEIHPSMIGILCIINAQLEAYLSVTETTDYKLLLRDSSRLRIWLAEWIGS